MKFITMATLAVYTSVVLAQNTPHPNVFTFQRQHGGYHASALHNQHATQEQKDAFNAELHKLGGEVSEKIKQLILQHKAILDLRGSHPIITLVCQWNNVEVIVEETKKEDHSSTTLPSSNAS